MDRRWLLVGTLLLVGCASFPNRYPTRAPAGRAADAIASDETACDAYGRSQPKQRDDHYKGCMVARGYTANVDLEHTGWTIGLMQTRPHDVATVMKDFSECDSRADNVKAAEIAAMPPDADAAARQQAFAVAVAATEGASWAQRPNAARVLGSCLAARGYTPAPWVPVNAR